MSDSEPDESDEFEYETEDESDKKISKSWDFFKKKKLVKTGQKKKNGKSKSNNIVVCQFKTNKGICGKVISHNDNSTGKMVRHLSIKHQISVKKKDDEAGEDDPLYYLLMFIITASLPFRCVENEFFKKFCRVLNKDFKLPDRKKLSDMASKYYVEKKTLLKLKLLKAKIVNFTTDCWTSVQNFSYIGLTAHFLDENFKLSSVLLAVRHIIGGHLSKNMSENIAVLMDEFEVDRKAKFITTDNVNSMVQMAKSLKLERIPCIAHILHLIVTNTLKEIKENCSKDSNEEFDCETEYVSESHPIFSNEDLLLNEKESLKIDSKCVFFSYQKAFTLFNSGKFF